jgi:hypothetical protein
MLVLGAIVIVRPSFGLKQFMRDVFHVGSPRSSHAEAAFPSLPALFTLVDTALLRGEWVTDRWPPRKLHTVRAGLEYLIFHCVHKRLSHLTNNYYTYYANAAKSVREQAPQL